MDEKMKTNVIETTLGDLIFAITEAARESVSDEKELPQLTQAVLDELLSRNEQVA